VTESGSKNSHGRVTEGRTLSDLCGSWPIRPLPPDQELRHFRGGPPAGQTTNTPCTLITALEQTQGLQPEGRNTQLCTTVDGKPGACLTSPDQWNTQQHPPTHSGQNSADTTGKSSNTRVHPTVQPGGFRQKTKTPTHLPTSGTKQYRHEGPPPPKTLPLDIQHSLGTWLVPPIPQVHGAAQREVPVVPRK